MSLLIGLLTVILVLNCVVLILLVLVQLPKKDAGAGLAFGGGTTEALFGAGTGNMLTKVTKYATVTFFVLTMSVAIMQSKIHHSRTVELDRLLQQQGSGVPALPASGAEPATPPAPMPLTSPESTPAPATEATEPN